MKKKEKQSKALYILYIYLSISIYLYPVGLHDSIFHDLFYNKLPRAIYKENYKTKYLRIFTLFPNLITKESYSWWITRRKWRFIQKYLKKNIQKCRSQLSGSFRRTPVHCAKMAAKFSQQKADFATVQKSSFSLE